MEAMDLARIQFAVTTLFHYIFVPLTLGLSVIVAVMQTQYVRTGNEDYKRMAKFWGKLFIINFAIGVVTGIVQEFQFGMNWSEYSRFVGDIFGAPLAIEALMAFFVESTFIGLWIFGWDKLSKRVHLGTIWMVALATNVSSLWILAANSWMQNPVGYELRNGRAEMVDFGALLTNSNLLVQFPHVVLSGFATGGFFVVAISAYRLLRARDAQTRSMFERSMTFGLAFGAFAILAAMLAGHAHGQHMVDTQPMKLAASEGLWEDEDPAAMSVFQIGSERDRRELINIRIPALLSLLTYNTPDGKVRGLNSINEEYQALYADRYGPDADYMPGPIWLIYWSFRAMVGAGMLMFLLAAGGLVLRQMGRLYNNKLFLRVLTFSVVLPFAAGAWGWVVTELGRQPWIVFGLLRVEEAVSPNVTVAYLLISLIGFTTIYTILAGVTFYLFWKYAQSNGGVEVLPDANRSDDDEAPDLTFKGAY